MKNGADKKYLFGVCVAVIAMLFAACGAFGSAGAEEATDPLPTEMLQPTAETAQMPTESENEEHNPGKEDGFVHSYPLGTTVHYDLNGDDIDEAITVTAQEYADGKLTIGSASLEFMVINPTGYFTVVNVDQSRNTLLIGISDYGFSDDDMTVLYAYDGEKISEVGAFEDLLGKHSYDRVGAICHGDGTITARVRMDILGTWTAVGLYQLSENGLEDITNLYRHMDWEGRITGWEVTVKADLSMYEDSEESSERTVVSEGTMVRMTQVRGGPGNDSHWVCFEVDSMGRTLWLPTEEIDWQTYVRTDDGLIDSEEVFDGFFYAG